MITRIIAVAGLLLLGRPATAEIAIDGAWSRPTPTAAVPGVVYLRIVNLDAEPDRLLALDSVAAARAELHATEVVDGVTRMRPVGTLPIPAQGTVSLDPGGLHVMLTGLILPLREGQRFSLGLTFERAGHRDVQVEVRRGAPAPSAHH